MSSFGRLCPAMTNGKNGKERKKISEAKRRQTQWELCRAFGHGRAPYEGRTTVGVPPRLSPKGLSSSSAQLQARLPGTWPLLLGGRYPPLPVPKSSEQLAPRS
ncbi:hypothetical protein SAMN05414138_1149 [Rhodoplanes sp. JGI PP 4-B12]|nr:hypothetical protein SAMN05414138_1149 [Rhodoplanes sp. JGI PP 4-B12]